MLLSWPGSEGKPNAAIEAGTAEGLEPEPVPAPPVATALELLDGGTIPDELPAAAVLPAAAGRSCEEFSITVVPGTARPPLLADVVLTAAARPARTGAAAVPVERSAEVLREEAAAEVEAGFALPMATGGAGTAAFAALRRARKDISFAGTVRRAPAVFCNRH